QNAGENRTDTRRPTKRKRQTEDERTRKSPRLTDVMEAFVLVKEVDFENPGQVNSKHNQEEAGELAEQPHARYEHLSNPGCGSAEQDEGNRKPDNEHDRIQQYRSQQRRVFLIGFELVQR